jgi:Flp pilus assembly pilin Flp
MLAILKFLSRDQSAAAAVEYGLLLALIALGAFFALRHLGEHVSMVYDRAGDAFDRHH